MEKRETRMQDGRYLIFYTFPEKLAASGMNVEENQEHRSAAEREPEAKPEAEEERSV
jgi:hypothetical protein